MISELFPEEKRKLNDLEMKLNQLDTPYSQISPTDIYAGLDEMEFRIQELSKLANNETKARREDYKRRILLLKNIHSHIKQSLDNIVKRRYPELLTWRKQDLFKGADLEASAFNQNDLEIGHSLDRSKNMINNYLEIGQETLSNLLSQKERLKGVQRKVLDIMNYLGVSNTIMKTVENRDHFDKLLVFGGMLIISLLLLFIWFFLIRKKS